MWMRARSCWRDARRHRFRATRPGWVIPADWKLRPKLPEVGHWRGALGAGRGIICSKIVSYQLCDLLAEPPVAEIVRAGPLGAQLDDVGARGGRDVRKGYLVSVRVFGLEKLGAPRVEQGVRIALYQESPIDVRLTPCVRRHDLGVPLHLRDEQVSLTDASRIHQEFGLRFHPGHRRAAGQAGGMLIRREEGVASEVGERRQIGLHAQLRVEEDADAAAEEQVRHELGNLAKLAIRKLAGLVGSPMDDRRHLRVWIGTARLRNVEERAPAGGARRLDERDGPSHGDRRVRDDRAILYGQPRLAVRLGVYKHARDVVVGGPDRTVVVGGEGPEKARRGEKGDERSNHSRPSIAGSEMGAGMSPSAPVHRWTCEPLSLSKADRGYWSNLA